jgi:hypothetical protein
MVMQTRVLKHLTKYNLSTEQYGFRIGLKTDNAAYKPTTVSLNAMIYILLAGGIFVIWRKHLIVLIMISFI